MVLSLQYQLRLHSHPQARQDRSVDRRILEDTIQDLNPEDGFFIDLSTVNNPQPIQGSSDAPTDPGPRTLKKKLGVV